MNIKEWVLLPILLLLWLIMKVGQLSRKIFFLRDLSKLLIIGRTTEKIIIWFWKKISHLRIPSFTFFQKKKKLGRPKTTPIIFKLLRRFNRYIKKHVPTSVRIGLALGITIAIVFSYSLFLIVLSQQLPTPEKLNDNIGPMTTLIYDRNGKLLYRLYEGRNRTLVNLKDIPPYLVNATIATEDKNFYKHPGVDVTAIARAGWAYVQNHQIQGGSTITQQLIKNTLLSPDRTIVRKVKEMYLAFWAERIYNKEQILQMYFNEVPYGGPAWGVEAASESFFGKGVKDLDLAQSAYLAGLPASPTTFSPYGNHPELAKARQKEVLRRMVEEGYISKEEAQKADAEVIDIKPPVEQIKAPHFVMYVREQLAQKYGERFVSQGGLKIVTTLDLDLQEKTQDIVHDEVANLGNLKVSNGAAMITDARTGQILTMIGSKDYFDKSYDGNVNVAVSLRQPGSSIKPITYATAFKQGYTPGTMILDTPVVFKNEWEVYSPGNYDGRFHGAVTIRTALGSSYNIPAVKTLAIVGIPEMIKTAQDLGITTFNDPNRYGLSLTLGGGEVKLVDMMTVYGTFSQMGIKHDLQPVLKITDSSGNVLEDNSQPTGSEVLNPAVAYLITDILQDNNARTPAFGPNSLLKIPNYHVAVKTGTTDSKRDNWTFGYTPQYVVGVWVGNNDNSPMDPQLTSGITGAAPIWNKIITSLLAGKSDLAFQRPLGVTEAMVDGHKDLTVSGIPPKSMVGYRPLPSKNPSEKTITFTDPFSTYAVEPQPPVSAPSPNP